MKSDNMNYGRIIIVFLFCLPLVACNSNPNRESVCSPESPDSAAGRLIDDQLFELVIENDSITYYIGDEIPLLVRNLSEHEIWFPADLNLFLVHKFGKTGDEIWETAGEILQNLSIPSTDDSLVLGRSGSSSDTYRFTIVPNLIDTGMSATVEILIKGNIYNQGEICTGLYGSMLTIVLMPKE